MSPAEEAQREKLAARELDLLRDLRALVLTTEGLNPGRRPNSSEWEKVFLAANRAIVGGSVFTAEIRAGLKPELPCNTCGRLKEPTPGAEQNTLDCLSCGRPVPNRLEKSWAAPGLLPAELRCAGCGNTEGHNCARCS